MSTSRIQEQPSTDISTNDQALIDGLKAHAQARFDVRRGVCLINAGRFDEAVSAFESAASANPTGVSLARYLAACHLGKGDLTLAAEQVERAVQQSPGDVTARVQHALVLWSAGRGDEAIQALRAAVAEDRESAELHFQLGVLLADRREYVEAELRFTQAVNIDRNHTEALLNLAMCCGVRRAPGEALKHLERAQQRAPHDGRIGVRLAQAAAAVGRSGLPVAVRAAMPPEPASDTDGIEELGAIIENDPDFVDALLSWPSDGMGMMDAESLAMLLVTLEQVLARQPEQAALQFQCGRVLARLGRPDEAIDANERAIGIKPDYVRALLELGRLYARTDRSAEAASRLELAISAGAESADVYYLLGNCYRDSGLVGEARSAYRHALLINEEYDAATDALETLSA
jgi:tetratricopeptide (TPR) repeat protein